MRIISLVLLCALICLGCSASVPRDLNSLAASVSVGMTPDEVIGAIGKPDRNIRNRIFSYDDGYDVLSIAFQEGKVVKVVVMTVPDGLKWDLPSR